MYLYLIPVVWVVIVHHKISEAAVDTNLLFRCCSLGTQWASNSERCDNYPNAVENIRQDDQRSCLALLEVCCMKQRHRTQCQSGKKAAAENSFCAIRDDVFGSEQYKECCHCCRVGIAAKAMRGDCNLLRTEEFGGPCDRVYKDCCLGLGANSTSTDKVGDIDECELYPNKLCSHICVNTVGSYRCECPNGYSLHTDESTCIRDQDSRMRCAIYNPCQQRCVDTDQGVRCQCNSGYILASDDRSCQDRDECREGVDNCSNTTRCVNYDGTFRCEPLPLRQCPNGSALHPVTRQCVTVRQCNAGYTFNIVNLVCEDIDECAREINTCTAEQRCENNDGSYSCRRIVGCGTGYSLDEETQTCIDIDECLLGTNNCGNGYDCDNIEGSFRCTYKKCPDGSRFNSRSGQCERVNCPRGFRSDSRGMCIDLDECQRPDICDVTETCVNSYGSYRCQSNYDCQSGYKADSRTSKCVDIDECTQGTHDCSQGQRCINRPGSFICNCPEGYRLSSGDKCQDVDECAYGNVCPYNAGCTNTPGSYRCDCNPGLRQEGRLCVDIDECLDANRCQHGCVNIIGSYHCTCEPGYQLSVDQRTCEDIDECRLYSNRGQICAGKCINLPGSYRCSCPDGWRSLANGRSCQDVDECSEGTARCRAQGAMCFNTRGSYKCPQIQCPSGFVRTPLGPGRNSVRCKRISFTCRQNDHDCINAPISLSYNFLSFPENVKVPSDLFAMSGPQTTEKMFNWELDVVKATPLRADSVAVNRGYFDLKIGLGEAVVALNYRISGAQDIELELRMKITDRYTRYTGTAVSKIFLYATGSNIAS